MKLRENPSILVFDIDLDEFPTDQSTLQSRMRRVAGVDYCRMQDRTKLQISVGMSPDLSDDEVRTVLRAAVKELYVENTLWDSRLKPPSPLRAD